MIKLFDRKLEYYSLAVFPAFVYWMLDDFFTNWLEPPTARCLSQWINTLCEILGNFLDIRVAVRSLISNKVLWQCEQWKSTDTGVYPTLRDVYYLISALKVPPGSRLNDYKDTAKNRLEGLFAVFSDHVCSRRRMDRQAFLTTDWAISLNGIPTAYQNLFISVMVEWIKMYRTEHNLRSHHIVDLFVLDEASTIFKKAYEAEGTYVLTDDLAQARAWGMGFIISTQNLANLAPSVLSNTSLKVMVGGAGDGCDYSTFAAATGMTVEQREYCKQRTEPGQAEARDPRYPFPFTVDIPGPVPFNAYVPIEVIRMLSQDRSKRFYPTGPALPPPEAPAHTPRDENDPGSVGASMSARDMSRDATDSADEGADKTVTTPPVTAANLPAELLRLLRYFLSLPSQMITQTALFKSAGITAGSVQSKWQHLLLVHGLIIKHSLPKGKGRIIIWEPTEKAWEITGITPPTRRSKGGYLHQGLCELIARSAQAKGYNVEIESFQANGKAIDLVLRKGEEQTWIELAMSEPMEKELSNIAKDFGSGIRPKKLIVACLNTKMKARLLELLAATPAVLPYRDLIEITLVGNLMSLE